MRVDLPGDDHPLRREVRRWLGDHPSPSGRDLAAAGYVAPHWPRPWGLDAEPLEQLVIDDELRRAGVRRPWNPIGIGWAGPTLLHAGTGAQQARWLPRLLSGEALWCQLFSEPGAGSDLASLKTTAVADDDEWVVTGQKVWTSLAHVAELGILLARTDPGASAHQGISYFVCPMHAAGVTVRPLVDMTGAHAFNEVFLDEVRLPADHLVGELHRGWELARVTLENERVSLSGEGALWGQGPSADDLVALVRAELSVGDQEAAAPGTRRLDAPLRDRLVRCWVEGEVLRELRARAVSASLAGRDPGPAASVRKALADDHGQELMGLARDMGGAYGTVDGTPSSDQVHGAEADAPPWAAAEWGRGFLFSPALTIGGGTAEVQRNIVGERLLGLPRDDHVGSRVAESRARPDP